MAAIKTFFAVEYLDNVLTTYDVMKVYRATDPDAGPWVEITGPGTRVALVAGQGLYEYLDPTGSTDSWYAWAYFNSATLAEGSRSEAIQGEDSGGLYASVQDLRDEGVTETMLSDDRALAKLMTWSQAIELWTGQWFEPRERVYTLDGDGGTVQRVGHPIIQVDGVELITGRGVSGWSVDTYDLEDLIVYNRHLTQGLLRPDDRLRPRLEVADVEGVFTALSLANFPRGRANIRIIGWFGWTELQPGDPVGEMAVGSQIPLSYGSTPRLIQLLTLLLVVRDQAQLADLESREDWTARWRLLEEKTRDQSYKLAPLDGGARGQAGAWTGDPAIDAIIASYRAGSRSQVEAV